VNIHLGSLGINKAIATLIICATLTISFIIPQEVIAQTPFVCETGPTGQEGTLTIAWPYPHTINSAVAKIFIHQVFRPDGTGGVTQARVEELIGGMIDEFHKFGISFEITGQDQIFALTHSEYEKPHTIVGNGGWGDGYRYINTNSDAIDIYIFGEDTTDDGGYSFSREVDTTHEFGVYGPVTSHQTLTHEMGHCFSLYHTFESGICGDTPFFPDCINCGDQVCDTPPDIEYIRTCCYDLINCVFTQQYYDDYYIHGYDVDDENFMSYYFPCLTHFSQGQIDRMFSAIENNELNIQNVINPLKISYEAPADPVAETGLNYPGTPYSSVVWNFDGDGFKDLFIAISDYPSRLYQGDDITPGGFPGFTEFNPVDFVNGPPQAGLKGLSVGDIDNQGTPELFAAHAVDSRLYQWDSINGKVVNLGVSSGVTAFSPHATAGSWGDYNNDGYLDLFISAAEYYTEDPPNYGAAKLTPASRLLTNNFASAGTIQFLTTPNAGFPTNLFSINSSWADYDSDGDFDIFVGALFDLGAGASKLYQNNGDNTFSDMTNLLQTSPLEMVNGCSWADMNNDLELDLVLSFHNQKPGIFYNTGLGGFDDGSGGTGPLRFGPDHGFSGLVVFDYNQDPNLDILGLSNDDSRPVKLFEHYKAPNESWVFLELPPSIGLSASGYAHGAVAADFGGSGGVWDGKKDLFIGRPTTSGEYIFRSTDFASPPNPSTHYLTIRLSSVSTSDNKQGIGATVTINTPEFSGIQMVDGGSMRGSQADSDLLFGLGEYSGPVTATVRWPSGLVQPDIPLQVDQLNVIENAPVAVLDATVTSRYTLQQGGLVDWVFSWETDYPSDPELDKVIFDLGSIPSQCQPGMAVLQIGASPDISLSYTAISEGGYSHVMTWSNRPCVPKCTIPFNVSSGVGSQVDVSDLKQLRIRICAGF